MKTLTQIIKAHQRNDVASGASGSYMFEEISPVGCSPVLYNAFSMYTSWDEGIGPLGIAPRTMKRMWPLLYVTEANVNVDDEQTNFTSSSSSSMTCQLRTSQRGSLCLQSKLGANTTGAGRPHEGVSHTFFRWCHGGKQANTRPLDNNLCCSLRLRTTAQKCRSKASTGMYVHP